MVREKRPLKLKNASLAEAGYSTTDSYNDIAAASNEEQEVVGIARDETFAMFETLSPTFSLFIINR